MVIFLTIELNIDDNASNTWHYLLSNTVTFLFGPINLFYEGRNFYLKSNSILKAALHLMVHRFNFLISFVQPIHHQNAQLETAKCLPGRKLAVTNPFASRAFKNKNFASVNLPKREPNQAAGPVSSANFEKPSLKRIMSDEVSIESTIKNPFPSAEK